MKGKAKQSKAPRCQRQLTRAEEPEDGRGDKGHLSLLVRSSRWWHAGSLKGDVPYLGISLALRFALSGSPAQAGSPHRPFGPARPGLARVGGSGSG